MSDKHGKMARIVSKLGSGLVRNDDGYRRLMAYLPFPVFQDFHESRKKTKVGAGANRSGKTFAATIEAISVFTGLFPPGLRWRFPVETLTREDWKKVANDVEYAEWLISQWQEQGPWPDLFPYDKYQFSRPRVVSVSVKTLEKDWPRVVKRYFEEPERGVLPKDWRSFNRDKMAYSAPDGSALFIASSGNTELSQANRGFKADYIMIDEASTRYAYTEALMRTIDRSGTVSLMFCGQDKGCMWVKDVIWDKCYDDVGNLRPVQPKEYFCQRFEIYDNPILPAEDVQIAMDSLTPEERRYRELGFFSEENTSPAFIRANVDRLFEGVREGQKVRLVLDEVEIEDGVWQAHVEPALKGREPNEPLWQVWDAPTVGHKYLAVVDPSEGFERSNFQVCDIWDMTRGELLSDTELKNMDTKSLRRMNYGWLQVAQLICRVNPVDIFSDQVCAMATLYGQCLLVPEDNERAGAAFIQRARYYGNIYRRQAKADAVNREPTLRYGWHTDRWNKPMLVSTLNTLLTIWTETRHFPFRSRQTVNELRVYSEKTEADSDGAKSTTFGSPRGKNDDCVTVAMIGGHVGFYDISSLTSMTECAKCAEDGAEMCGFPHRRGSGRGPFTTWRHGRKTLKQCRASSKRVRFLASSSSRTGSDSPGSTSSTAAR